jgi:NAD-dependent SIR2 family protein deacetylase
MYKLHGSFNWLYCPQCRKMDVIIVNPEGRRLLPYDANSESLGICPICQTKYEAVIITPTALKDYSNPYLATIWQKAEEKLKAADNIIFIGYSLPPEDNILCDMFVRAIQSNHNLKGKKPNITVVDCVKDFKENDPNKNATYLRYKNMFGDIDYRAAGFILYAYRMKNNP